MPHTYLHRCHTCVEPLVQTQEVVETMLSRRRKIKHVVIPLHPKISASPVQPLLFRVVWLQRRALMSVQKRDQVLLMQGKPFCCLSGSNKNINAERQKQGCIFKQQ